MTKSTTKFWPPHSPMGCSPKSFSSPSTRLPKDNGQHAIQGHILYECRRSHDCPRVQAKEKRKKRRSSSQQRKKDYPNKRSKGRQEIKTSTWEDRQLHTIEYPARPSPHADKGRCGTDLARQAKGQSEQKA